MLRSLMTVSGFTLISRILGFLRDVILLGIIGVGMTSDAFFAAFRFPNMFRRIFGEGAFNSAFVPLFGRKVEEEGKPEAMLFARNAFSTLMVILGVVSVIAILGMEFLMMAVVPGFRAKFDRDLTNVGASHATYSVVVDTQGAREIYIELEGHGAEVRGQWAKRIKLTEMVLTTKDEETKVVVEVDLLEAGFPIEGMFVSAEGGAYLTAAGLVRIPLPRGHVFDSFRTLVDVEDLVANADVYPARLKFFRNDPGTFDLTVELSRIMFCYLLFMALAAHLSGVLNTFKVFAMPAAAPIILNLVFLGSLGLIWKAGWVPALTLSWGVALAGVLQFGALWVTCLIKKVPIWPMRPRFTPEMKRLFLLMGPGVLAAGIQQINLLVGGIIASFQEGAISHLYTSERVYQLPLGMIGISLGVVLLPEVTRQLRGGNERAASESIERGMELGLLLTLPAAVAMIVIPIPLIATLFERGKFTSYDSMQSGYAMVGFALGLPGYVLIKVLQPGYFGREDTRSPMIMAGITVAVNVVCSMVLFLLLRPYGYGHVGIAVATSIAAWVNVFLLWRGLRGFLQVHDRTRKKLWRMLAASVLMGVAVWICWWTLEDWFQYGPWHKIVTLTLLVGWGALCYGWLVVRLKVTSLGELKEGFGRG